MREVLTTIVKGARSMTTHKSNLRLSLEKSSKIWVAPLAIAGALMLILDAVATWKSNNR